MAFDGPWKEALESYFEAFAWFFLPETAARIDWSIAPEFKDTELRQIVPESGSRAVDKLVRVVLVSGDAQCLYIHVEIQSRKQDEFERRMFAYYARLFLPYNDPILSCAVMGDPVDTWRPGSLELESDRCRLRFDFPIIKLLDYRPELERLEAGANPFGTVVCAHVRALETQRDPANRLTWKIRLVKGLYASHAERDVRLLFRFIDWLLELPDDRDDVFWSEIRTFEQENDVEFMTTPERIGRREGLREGIERGIEQGIEQGRCEGLAVAIAIALDAKFAAALDAPVRQRLLAIVNAVTETATLGGF